MSRSDLKKRIKEGVLVLDGAMGTELFARGLEAGKCNDYANIESADIVRTVHSDYFEAGSDAVLTNTFGANKFALGLHGLSDKVEQINTAAAKIAREAAGEDRYVLGDIGPSGQFLPPLGTVTADELKAAFAEQAKALVAGGVDGLIIETFTALDEIELAIEAAKSVAGQLSVFASMSFDPAGGDFRTMMGVDVASAVTKIISLGVDAAGFNCGKNSLDDYLGLAKEYTSIVKSSGSDVALLAEPNAGLPEVVDEKTVYKVTPEAFSETAEKIHAAGFNILGGCCGTTPAHIKAMAAHLKK
ncbi:MAG: homocysteine S-methyltransferase family protein [Phycisphaerales bacterium]